MDTIYQAISTLYDNPNAGEKEKASLWLGDMQKSVSILLNLHYIILPVIKLQSVIQNYNRLYRFIRGR